MEKTVEYFGQHPVLFVASVMISVLILFSSLKKIVELVLMVGSLVVLYTAYLYITGGHVPEVFRSVELLFSHWFHAAGDMFAWLFTLLKFPKKGVV